VYDDIECPCTFELNGKSYIIGSIREDIKVRYWFSSKFMGEYRNFRSDVLLPQGNYAARVVKDGDHFLIYNFFFKGGSVNELRVLPPPKQLDAAENGRLLLRSFYRWDQMVEKTITQENFPPFKTILSNETAKQASFYDRSQIGAKSGYEIFTFEKPTGCFIWEGRISVVGMGKFGLVSDMDDHGNGYFYSFDISNGFVQIRAWGYNAGNNQSNFIFNNIQSNIFKVNKDNTLSFRLIRYGNYIELSIDDEVKLTLIDYTYDGNRIGLYSASSQIELTESRIKFLPDSQNEYASQEQASTQNLE
jgi:beta-fructofuranosidase